ncbi:hypothetical protein SCP_1900900 [Sparassis crispa]|uniref:Uncharacterized protein n=1 Tax=Sparassis crispa TaxID=139825 RepID=A0A401H781_9APHY|nr:hypothetical protein SCP_1900900 [Sparassis crispa]GBE90241.1 hypothetical protein SCP_1900900 [Sparassis crispa]
MFNNGHPQQWNYYRPYPKPRKRAEEGHPHLFQDAHQRGHIAPSPEFPTDPLPSTDAPASPSNVPPSTSRGEFNIGDAPTRPSNYAFIPHRRPYTDPPSPPTDRPFSPLPKNFFNESPAPSPGTPLNLPKKRPLFSSPPVAPSPLHYTPQAPKQTPIAADPLPGNIHPTTGPQRVHVRGQRARPLQRGYVRHPPLEVIQAEAHANVSALLAANPLAQKVMDEGPLDNEDCMLLKQFSRLVVQKVIRSGIDATRDAVQRAAVEMPQRIKEIEEHDKKAKELWEEEERRVEAERLADQRRVEQMQQHAEQLRMQREQVEQAHRLDELNRLHKAWMGRRWRAEREESRRKAEELRKRERLERERRCREEAEARLQQEEEARRRQEEARRQQEATRRRQEEAARQRQEEALREAQAAEAVFISHAFESYDYRWSALRQPNFKFDGPVRFFDMPWPVFIGITAPEDITEDCVRDFLFHPQRLPGKTRREVLKGDILKWHPDKFKVQLPKVHEADRSNVAKAAGIVARILIKIKEEEDNNV